MGGQPVIDYETKHFQEIMKALNLVDMKALNLVDMKALGRHFTWTNNHVWSEIDNAICNDMWVMDYGGIVAQFLKNHISDHSPIHIDITKFRAYNRKSFRFINELPEEESFYK